MKERGSIQQQYKQVKYRARKVLLEQKLRREPGNCGFFRHVAVKDGAKVGICDYASMVSDPAWDVITCDTEQAKHCSQFTAEASSEELKERFERFISAAETGDRHAMGSLAYLYPDLAALLWVMEPWEGEEENVEKGCCGSCNNCGTELCGHFEPPVVEIAEKLPQEAIEKPKEVSATPSHEDVAKQLKEVVEFLSSREVLNVTQVPKEDTEQSKSTSELSDNLMQNSVLATWVSKLGMGIEVPLSVILLRLGFVVALIFLSLVFFSLLSGLT